MNNLKYLKLKVEHEKNELIQKLESEYKGPEIETHFAKFFKGEIDWNVLMHHGNSNVDQLIESRKHVIEKYGELSKRIEDSYYRLNSSNSAEYMDIIALRIKTVIAEHFAIEESEIQEEIPVEVFELDIVEIFDELSGEFNIDLYKEVVPSKISVSYLQDLVLKSLI